MNHECDGHPAEVRYQLAAIMFTDVSGYTAMMASDERKALDLLRESRKIHKSAIAAHNGKWLKEMGDGVLAQFSAAQDAVRCACDIQRAAQVLHSKIRIGIHLGDVAIEHGDIFGDGVNIAARIESIAEPGGIYISDSVNTAIRSLGDMQTQRIGPVKLKNVRERVVIYAIRGPGLTVPDATRIFELTHDGRVKSLAVLPFKHLSHHHDKQFFVDGMHDALIGALSQIKSLRVISRTSSLRYRNTEKSVPEIAAELGIDAIVEATVFRNNGEVSIQVQLVRAFPEEDHLWAGSYQKTVRNVLALYNDVVRDVATQLEARLTQDEQAYLDHSDEVDPKAYETYLRGMFHWEKLSTEDLEAALQYFDQARMIAPGFALAYSGSAGVWLARMTMGLVSPEKAIPHIYLNIRKTHNLDTHNAEAYFWNASLMTWSEWDWANARQEFETSLQLKPSLAIARIYYAHLLAILGETQEALRQSTQAVELDPFNPLITGLYAMVLNFARQYDDAVAVIQNILAGNRNHPIALSTLRSVYHNQGNYDEAYRVFRQSYQEKGDMEAVTELDAGFESGGYPEALNRVAHVLSARSGEHHVTPWQIATLYMRAGRTEKSMISLEAALEVRDPNVPYMRIDPIFDPLQNEPRFNAILKQIHLM